MTQKTGGSFFSERRLLSINLTLKYFPWIIRDTVVSVSPSPLILLPVFRQTGSSVLS